MITRKKINKKWTEFRLYRNLPIYDEDNVSLIGFINLNPIIDLQLYVNNAFKNHQRLKFFHMTHINLFMFIRL